MDLKQLRAVVTVAESGSVTRAAELLHLVQPAVTRQIRALEHELGVPLFERTRQGMRLTKAGESLVERARRALGELERARAEIQPQPDIVSGLVTIGLLESATELVAEPLVSSLTKTHPGIRLRLMSAYSGYLERWLDAGDIDLSLLYNLTSTPSLHVRPLLRENLWAAGPPDAGLGARESVSLAEVATHPLVMPAGGHGLRTLIDAGAVRADVELNVAVETNSMEVQKQLVLAGHGWTILPGIGLRDDVVSGRLVAAPVSDPEIWRAVVIGLPRSGRTPPAVEIVADRLATIVADAVDKGKWPSAQLHGLNA